jgi:putative membrane protein
MLTIKTKNNLQNEKISLVAMIALAALSFQACNNAAKDSKETADSVNAVKDTTTDGNRHCG